MALSQQHLTSSKGFHHAKPSIYRNSELHQISKLEHRNMSLLEKSPYAADHNQPATLVCVIGVVRKTFRLRTFFPLQSLMPPSYFRNIIMTSGITIPNPYISQTDRLRSKAFQSEAVVLLRRLNNAAPESIRPCEMYGLAVAGLACAGGFRVSMTPLAGYGVNSSIDSVPRKVVAAMRCATIGSGWIPAGRG